MKIFWISFSIFFIIASVIGLATVVYWIVDAIKKSKIKKIAAIKNEQTKINENKDNVNKKN